MAVWFSEKHSAQNEGFQQVIELIHKYENVCNNLTQRSAVCQSERGKK